MSKDRKKKDPRDLIDNADRLDRYDNGGIMAIIVDREYMILIDTEAGKPECWITTDSTVDVEMAQ